MPTIEENIQNTLAAIHKLNTKTELLVATKYATIDEVKEVIRCGIKSLGENKIQDAEEKILALRSLKENNPAISWHFIGHLQSNKVNKAVALFDYIQSVDSLKLAEKINESAKNIGKTQKILIQINIGEEEQKSGFSKESYFENSEKLFALHNVQILGIMVIVPHTKNDTELREFFRQTKQIFDQTKKDHNHIHILSMGMSEDFKLAIEEGSTLVRVGRSIFKR